jgi:hypothetical protein
LQEDETGKFQARARRYGTKSFTPVGQATDKMETAIRDMTVAFADDEIYEQAEVVRYEPPDGSPRPKMTMTKKRDAEKLIATRKFEGEPG